MSTSDLLLVIPEKPDPERDAVAKAWEMLGGTVLRLGRFWDPPELDVETVRVYGNDTFCLVLQQKLGVQLCSPEDDLICQVPTEFLRRHVHLRGLSDIDTMVFPTFVKSVVPKQIRSRIYTSASELRDEGAGLDQATALIVSEPVRFVSELRAFVLEASILDSAFYEGDGDRSSGNAFVSDLVQRVNVPRSVVVDVGQLPDGSWALVEFNSAWGAGLNGCDPMRVVPAIAHASGPLTDVATSTQASV